jgi:hypothetical protein
VAGVPTKDGGCVSDSGSHYPASGLKDTIMLEKHKAKKPTHGVLTDAEFETQKARLLGE